jgi:hypothetical protein
MSKPSLKIKGKKETIKIKAEINEIENSFLKKRINQ